MAAFQTAWAVLWRALICVGKESGATWGRLASSQEIAVQPALARVVLGSCTRSCLCCLLATLDFVVWPNLRNI